MELFNFDPSRFFACLRESSLRERQVSLCDGLSFLLHDTHCSPF
jgi:hypothetical protein